MASSKDSHLSDIISIVQARPKSPAPVEEPPEKTPEPQPEPEQISKETVEPVIEKSEEPVTAPEPTQPKEAEPAPAIVQQEVKAPVKKRKSRAGRKPLPDKNRRSEILIIRLTKAEKKKLWELAKRKHTTLSSFVRKSSIGEYDKE